MAVLIVDDLPFMRFLIRDAVEKAGYQVVGEASDGRQAVRSYMQYPGSVVLMDIRMPVLDGISALGKILGLDASARIIMCSSIDEQDLIIKTLHMGARDYIVKPFHQKRMEDVLRRAHIGLQG